MLDNIGLMKGIGGKMNWLNQRQGVLAKNIANADTPNFRPSDLEKVDFESVMKSSRNRPTINKVTTNPGHIGANPQVGEADNRESKKVYEASPDDNAVIIEEQLLKAGTTQADYNLITNLYRKNVSMIKFVVAQ